MAKKAILYIDLLGVQQLWSVAGAGAVRNRIHEFNDFIIKQLEFLPGDIHRDGEYTVILSGDSVSVTCQDFDQAIGIGIHLFKQAFYAREVSKPLWLRGAISSWRNQYLPYNTKPIHAKGLQVGTEYVLEDDYLHVLALEKSGFKGMRLIVDRDHLVEYGNYHTRNWDGFSRVLRIVARLREDHMYPAGNNYADILWMADSEEHYDRLKGLMSQRFKRATADIGELNQAAWTRAVFDQVESLIWLCRQDHSGAHSGYEERYDVDDEGDHENGVVTASKVAKESVSSTKSTPSTKIVKNILPVDNTYDELPTRERMRSTKRKPKLNEE